MKKKSSFTPTLKAITITVLVVPTLVFFRGHIQSIWASPDKLSQVEKDVKKQETALEQIAQLSLEQKSRMDTQEKVSALQIEALKEQISYVSELKRKK